MTTPRRTKRTNALRAHVAALVAVIALTAWITLDPPPTAADGRTVALLAICGAVLGYHTRTDTTA